MEFWGVEVKSGEPLKVEPELGKLIHISQAALGEVKETKGAKNVPLRLKIDNKNFIIGSLSAGDRTQLMFDLVIEREFELSHDWKNGSVYFIGYIADEPASDDEVFSDDYEDNSEDELVEAKQNGNMKPKSGGVEAVKTASAAGGGKAKAGAKKEVPSDSDDEEDDGESDSDEEMTLGGLQQDSSIDGSEEDSEDEDDSSEEEELPKVQQSKKRPAGKAPAKKAKSATPEKTGKKVKTPTPVPSKAAGNKSKEQTQKFGNAQSKAKAKKGGK